MKKKEEEVRPREPERRDEDGEEAEMAAPKRRHIVREREDEEEDGEAGPVMRSVRVKLEPGEEGVKKEEVVKMEQEEEETVDIQYRLRTLYTAIPLKSKSGPEVKAAVLSVIARLNAEGKSIRRIHSDRGMEFRTVLLREWCQANGIHATTTSADDSRANGRAEGGIGIFKRRVRVLLKGANLGQE